MLGRGRGVGKRPRCWEEAEVLLKAQEEAEVLLKAQEEAEVLLKAQEEAEELLKAQELAEALLKAQEEAEELDSSWMEISRQPQRLTAPRQSAGQLSDIVHLQHSLVVPHQASCQILYTCSTLWSCRTRLVVRYCTLAALSGRVAPG